MLFGNQREYYKSVDDYIWVSLVISFKFEVIELLRRVELGKLRGKKIKVNKPFHENSHIHKIICSWIEERGVPLFQGKPASRDS